MAGQDATPIRVTLPWKYGVNRPHRSWKGVHRQAPGELPLAGGNGEYGFRATLNPDLPPPRPSQAQERLLGSDEMVPTRICNGCGEYGASRHHRRNDARLPA